jgi:hypothetical protein
MLELIAKFLGFNNDVKLAMFYFVLLVLLLGAILWLIEFTLNYLIEGAMIIYIVIVLIIGLIIGVRFLNQVTSIYTLTSVFKYFDYIGLILLAMWLPVDMIADKWTTDKKQKKDFTDI